MTALAPQQFVTNWSNTQLKESAVYVSHFNDLCELVGHDKPAQLDKTGATFTYQKGVLKSDGGQIIGQGFADVWFKDHFAIEYKGPGKYKTLTEALKQLRGYAGSLENPPLLVVCDIEHYEVHTNFNGAVTRVYAFTNADIASPRDVPGTRFTAFQILHHLFHDPEILRPQRTITDVTEQAARQFADLSESIHRKNPQLDTRQVARFLVKMVFCLFCEDVGLLPKNLFARIVEKTMDSKTKFTRSLRDLFQAMATGGDIWGEDIPTFDGGLFHHNDAGQDVIDLDGADARAVLKAAGDNWADIDPTIFGSLFQRALDIEGRRAELGAHYTSRSDITTIVEPVLMQPLRAEWGEIKLSAAKLAAASAPSLRGASFATKQSPSNEFEIASQKALAMTDRLPGKSTAAIRKLIAPFLERLAALKVLDPACGSGNFLYVSLTLLKDLEQAVIAFAANLGLTDFEPRVSPAQLYGLEKDDFAHELASIVVWIGFLQWKLKNGYDPAGETPILKSLNNIQHMDAILTRTPLQ
ncbi:MAG TPA: DNA methyltransferase, partial [Anaerolineae bacterium]|nr:DNA methyltransferase [Anaerolineae bacterium]